MALRTLETKDIMQRLEHHTLRSQALAEASAPPSVPEPTFPPVPFTMGADQLSFRARLTSTGYAVEQPCPKTGIWKELFPLPAIVNGAAIDAVARVALAAPQNRPPLNRRMRKRRGRLFVVQLSRLPPLTVGTARILVNAAYRMVGHQSHFNGQLERLYWFARDLGSHRRDPPVLYRPGSFLIPHVRAVYFDNQHIRREPGSWTIWQETLRKIEAVQGTAVLA